MITRSEQDTGAGAGYDETASTAHQRSPRTDPGMRDGDSGQGNPGETDAATPTTDNDVGDAYPGGATTLAPESRGRPAEQTHNSNSVPAESAEVVRTRGDGADQGMVEPHSQATVRSHGLAGEGRHDPGRQGPAGSNPERRQEYERLVDQFGEGGRYPGREEEVAARIVNKQRREFGETKAESGQEHRGQAPDRNLPIVGYQHLTVPEIIRQAGTLSIEQLREVKEYEKSHRRRKTLLTKLERMLRSPPAGGGREGESAGRDRGGDQPHRT